MRHHDLDTNLSSHKIRLEVAMEQIEAQMQEIRNCMVALKSFALDASQFCKDIRKFIHEMIDLKNQLLCNKTELRKIQSTIIIDTTTTIQKMCTTEAETKINYYIQ